MQTYYVVLDGKQDKNEENNEVVVNSLKKYKRKMFILKIIVAILSIFIIAIWGSFIVERVKYNIQLNKDYEKGEYISGIIDEASNKIEEIINSDNYSIVEETIGVNYDLKCVSGYSKNETSYKDGYIKEKYISDSGSIKSDYNSAFTNYGVLANDRMFSIQQNDSGSSALIGTRWGTSGVTYNFLDGFHKENVLEYKDYEIREEEIDGKDYYIISTRGNREDSMYNTEIWLNKDNMILFKIIDEKVGCSKTEQKFTISINTVRDEDARIKFAQENESSKKLMEVFEELKNFEGENYYEIIDKWDFSEDSSKVIFDKYDKADKKVIIQNEAVEKAIEFIEDKYGIRAGQGYRYKGIIFDQNGDAYYACEVKKDIDSKNEFEQNVFVSIFGDTIKTNETEMDIKTGDMVIL